jgi:tripartite-type tricarboxylate transporter receptor subunit TctC
MKSHHRKAARAAALFVLCAASIAHADTWPSKPIRLISPFVPGGGASLVARLVGPDLTEVLGQSIVVDNRGGGGGVIGSEIAAHSRPDGYTLVMGTASNISVRPLVDKVPYDPLKDFTPIIQATTVPLVLCVHPSVPVKTVKEFIAFGRAKDSKLNFASSGEGTISHLAGELFKMSSGVQMSHVPYKGGGQAIIDVIAGHVQVGFINILEASSQIKSERLRALAVTTAERSPILPNVPTVGESGLAGYEVTQWSGMFAPAGTPAAIIARLNAELDKILHKPLTRERLAADGAQPGGGSAEKFSAFVKADIEKWSKVVKNAGLAK